MIFSFLIFRKSILIPINNVIMEIVKIEATTSHGIAHILGVSNKTTIFSVNSAAVRKPIIEPVVPEDINVINASFLNIWSTSRGFRPNVRMIPISLRLSKIDEYEAEIKLNKQIITVPIKTN